MDRKSIVLVSFFLALLLLSLGLGIYYGRLTNKTSIIDKPSPDTEFISDKIVLNTNKDEFIGKDVFSINTKYPVKLVDFFVDPEFPEVVEYVMELNLDGKSIKFRVRSAPCIIRIQDPQLGIVFYQIPIEKLTKGQDMILTIVGLENPLSQQELDLESEVCKTVWSELGSHSDEMEKVINVFEKGDVSDFSVDSDGIYDLRSNFLLADILNLD